MGVGDNRYVSSRCTSPELIGREVELAALASCLDRAEAGQAGLGYRSQARTIAFANPMP